MGIKGVKTMYLLVVYIPARMAKVTVTCINNTLKNIPHSLLVARATQFIEQRSDYSH